MSESPEPQKPSTQPVSNTPPPQQHITFVPQQENQPKTNGIDHSSTNHKPSPSPSPKEMPKPAPRRFTTSSSSEPSPTTPKPPPQTTTTNHKKASSSNSSLDEDVQVLQRPITNEEFQAMIPPHFLKQQPTQNTSKASTTNRPNSVHSFYPNSENACDTKNPADSVSVTTVTIKKPDPIDLPPPPTGPGRVTETITKSTFTETVVTRITDNKLVAPLIIEVGGLSTIGRLILLTNTLFSTIFVFGEEFGSQAIKSVSTSYKKK